MTVTTNSPSSTYVITAGWTNPTDAYSSDNVRTYTPTTTAAQGYGNYGFSFAAGTVIDKVEFGIERYTSVSGDTISLYYSVDGGTSWTFVTSSTPTSETLDYYDRTADRTWTLDLLSDANLKTKILAYLAGGCLIEGTKILTPEGPKNIEELNVGDYVVGNENGRKVFSKIKAKTTHFLKTMCHEYKGTGFAGNHKVWVDGEWKNVYDIQPNAREYEGFIYNIETELGNYYGENDLLIHNLTKT